MSTSTVDAPTKVATYPRWTVDLVQQMPQVIGERYEIIDGELYVTRQPHTRHQAVCTNIIIELGIWSRSTDLGRVLQAPGIIYSEVDAVIPDVVWVSKDRIATIIGPDGKLHESPELMIEVLSPGNANAERDREKKLDLYGRHDVQEYWIADWQAGTVEIYRRAEDKLTLVQTLCGDEELTSPMLPSFTCVISRFFEL